jgi:histone H3/H4
MVKSLASDKTRISKSALESLSNIAMAAVQAVAIELPQLAQMDGRKTVSSRDVETAIKSIMRDHNGRKHAVAAARMAAANSNSVENGATGGVKKVFMKA